MDNGETALYFADLNGHEAVVRLLHKASLLTILALHSAFTSPLRSLSSIFCRAGNSHASISTGLTPIKRICHSDSSQARQTDEEDEELEDEEGEKGENKELEEAAEEEDDVEEAT